MISGTESKNLKYAFFIALFIVIGIAGIFAWQYFEKQKEEKKTSYETDRLTVEEIENSDDMVSFLKDFASQKNIDAYWVSVSPECVSYLPWDNYVWDEKSYLSVELHERHNETCVGDPNTAPRLETFLYDKEEKRIFVLNVLSGLIPFDAYIQSHATVLDETAGWQTYRDDRFGFEIKYPMDWDTVPTRFFRYFYPKKTEISGTVTFRISTDAADSLSPFKAFGERSEDFQETFIGARKFYWKEYESDQISKIVDYYLLSNDGLRIAYFRFSVLKENEYSSLQEIENTLIQMLSTFRFIEK